MKRYDKQFKVEAVRLVLESKRPVTEVANGLGIHENTLYKWLRQFKGDGEDAFPGSGCLKPEDREIRRLQRMVADLKEENAILKKATAIFAKHQK